MRKEVEALEHKTDPRTDTGNVGLAVLNQLPTFLAVAHQITLNIDTSAIDLLQVIDTAQQGSFSRATGPDDYDDLTAIHGEINAIQNGEIAKAFDHLLRTYHLPTAILNGVDLTVNRGQVVV